MECVELENEIIERNKESYSIYVNLPVHDDDQCIC